MPSPTFAGAAIFDSIYSSGSQCEGVCMPLDYEKIIQPIHFNGENGDYILTHGWPDRVWTFEGNLYAHTGAAFGGILVAIENAIDAADSDSSTYETLVDSFGRSFGNAQVRKLTYIEKPRATSDGGYICKVRVTGIIQGMTQDQGGDD